MIRIAINGILGKMGREVASAVGKHGDLILVGGVDTLETYYSDEFAVSINPDEIIPEADVVVDFSSGEGAMRIAGACQTHQKPLITGTTGLTTTQQAEIVALSRKMPVVQASNFSPGINFLIHILQQAAEFLKDRFDYEIVEIHHRMKKDAPSGTALLLANTLAEGLKLPKTAIQSGRSGIQQNREQEIAVHALRGGSVVGEHQVHLLGQYESLVLTHQAHSRKAFVDGVIRAIHWIPGRPPGLYGMGTVLGS